jgi:endoglucanase
MLLFMAGCGSSTKSLFKQPTPSNHQEESIQPKIDDVYDKQILSTTSWRVDKGVILKNDIPIFLRGISWFGFETNELVVHGLWTGRSIASFLQQVRDLGFNALRLPVSPQVFRDGFASGHGKPKPIDNLNELLSEAKRLDINVLLDLHNCDYKAGLNGNPIGCNGGLDNWLNTLGQMAELSLHYDNVLGIDVFNEPYNVSWKNWSNLSAQAARKILAINPRLIIYVEGVGSVDTNTGGLGGPNWGGNLVEAGNNLPDIPVSRLVLSPHAYGPSVSWQSYFSDAAGFPGNMDKIWDSHFGYLTSKGFVVSVGEFGGRYTERDKVWQDTFISYLVKKDMRNFFYWSLNPNSGDTGGILNDDWTTVNKDKMDLLKKLF